MDFTVSFPPFMSGIIFSDILYFLHYFINKWPFCILTRIIFYLSVFLLFEI